jgi:hypothetical protein
VLTSERAREFGSVDHRVQVLADEAEGGDHHTYWHEAGRIFGATPLPRVTS